MSRLATQFGTRPQAITLAPHHAPVVWTLRVQCAEAWDAVKVELSPETRVRDVKQAAMAQLLPDVDALESYVVKLRGIEVQREELSVHAAGAIDGSTLLIMSRRRRPVR